MNLAQRLNQAIQNKPINEIPELSFLLREIEQQNTERKKENERFEINQDDSQRCEQRQFKVRAC